jgi:hypothetical protein
MMPVRKYRSVEEMENMTWRRPLDPENLRIALSLSHLAYRLRPWHLTPGVRKFRSVEEANRHREEREAAEVAGAEPR